MRSEVNRSARRRAPVLARRLAACAGTWHGLSARGSPTGRLRRSFTLIEVLVAVGAVALVAVALAAVFDQTGRTVTAGRRLSAITSYAALIEQQMRADFSRMTRDGYLIIRNELADADNVDGFTPGVDVIPLHADDLRARPRRTDELMFFVKGDFTTSRDPLHPSQVARGNAARIYYGHGKRRVPDTTPPATSPYLWPWLADLNDEPEANLGVNDPTNPNRFASEWTLLRLQTVLIPPRTTQTEWPQVGSYAANSAELWDKDTQIAYQPAASGIYRALTSIFPTNNPPEVTIRGTFGPGSPAFVSGLVDIASTSLAEVRAVVVTADSWPGGSPAGVTGQPADEDFFAPFTVTGPDGNGNADGFPNAGIDGQFQQWAQVTGLPGDPNVVLRMQTWMEDGLPAWSHARGADFPDRARVRYEPSAPNYLEVLRTPAASPAARLQQAWERTDQVMLSSSNFLPRCTEFIVEWTFGKTYPSDPAATGYVAGREGEIIWHGMARRADATPTTTTINEPQRVVEPYTWDPNGIGNPLYQFRQRFRRNNGTLGARDVISRLIHGQGVGISYQPPVGDPVTSYFGYVDPIFDPDSNNNGQLEDPNDAQSPTIPWAWPKLVRVTMGLADPNDPTIEQRFQFVFETPPTPEP